MAKVRNNHQVFLKSIPWADSLAEVLLIFWLQLQCLMQRVGVVLQQSLLDHSDQSNRNLSENM